MKKKTKTAIVHDHPGRPKYLPKFPRTDEWTFNQFMAINDVDSAKYLVNGKPNPNFGKGPNCTMLTLRKWLGRDLARKGHSEVCVIKGVTAEPDSTDGLGRRAKLYRLRSVPAKDHSADKAPRKARKVNSTAKADDMVAKAKAILAEPTPAVVIAPAPAPVIPTAPVVPAESPETTAAFADVTSTPVETVTAPETVQNLDNVVVSAADNAAKGSEVVPVTIPVVNITPEPAPVEVTIANETPASEVAAVPAEQTVPVAV